MSALSLAYLAGIRRLSALAAASVSSSFTPSSSAMVSSSCISRLLKLTLNSRSAVALNLANRTSLHRLSACAGASVSSSFTPILSRNGDLFLSFFAYSFSGKVQTSGIQIQLGLSTVAFTLAEADQIVERCSIPSLPSPALKAALTRKMGDQLGIKTQVLRRESPD